VPGFWPVSEGVITVICPYPWPASEGVITAICPYPWHSNCLRRCDHGGYALTQSPAAGTTTILKLVIPISAILSTWDIQRVQGNLVLDPFKVF
jgi:hypothetical protein